MVTAYKPGGWHASREVNVTADSEAAYGYLAGIMDGEGYFAASAKTNAFGIRVAMIDACVVDWLHEHFAGSVSRAGRTKTGNQIHTWTLARQADLAHVLPRLMPLLVCKRAQAEAMLALVEHLLNKPHHPTPSSRTGKFERVKRSEQYHQWLERRETLRLAIPAAR